MATDTTIMTRHKIPMLIEHRTDEGITFSQEDAERFCGQRTTIDLDKWVAMGRPVEITVTIEPGNTMDVP